ncbi:MAG: YceI family protein [Burkholderiales bacterium]|nr:YceI family protein [Phycisphaerae bacterium]
MMPRLLILAVTFVFSSSMAIAQSYAVDPVHSSIGFKVKHLETSNFHGRFNKAQGEVKLESGAPVSVHMSVDVESIDTANKNRDAHLIGPDFFAAKDFPDITFKSTSVKKLDDTTFEVAGDLTLHGVTKPLTVKLVKTGSGQNMQKKEIVGFETSFSIKRSDHGMTGYIDKGIGDEVTLNISVECVKQ